MIPNNKTLSLHGCYKNWFMVKENNQPKNECKNPNIENKMKIL
jgi:hypothetical protein